IPSNILRASIGFLLCRFCDFLATGRQSKVQTTPQFKWSDQAFYQRLCLITQIAAGEHYLTDIPVAVEVVIADNWAGK
ncbi:MAG: hypothetical protein QGI86_25260, partial [Candidatus Poribacteria bacterium]|nr:hypothetical protein [Candidatus Poribacteria bacterium]